MEDVIKDILKMGKCMAKDILYGLMEENMKVNITTILNMGKENLDGQTDQNI